MPSFQIVTTVKATLRQASIYLNVDRAFDPMRNDPRFHVALKRVSLVPEVDEVVSR